MISPLDGFYQGYFDSGLPISILIFMLAENEIVLEMLVVLGECYGLFELECADGAEAYIIGQIPKTMLLMFSIWF